MIGDGNSDERLDKLACLIAELTTVSRLTQTRVAGAYEAIEKLANLLESSGLKTSKAIMPLVRQLPQIERIRLAHSILDELMREDPCE